MFSFTMQRVSVFIKIWDLSTLGSKKGIQIIYKKLYWLCCQFRRINDNCVEKKKKKRKYAWKQGSPSISNLCIWLNKSNKYIINIYCNAKLWKKDYKLVTSWHFISHYLLSKLSDLKGNITVYILSVYVQFFLSLSHESYIIQIHAWLVWVCGF